MLFQCLDAVCSTWGNVLTLTHDWLAILWKECFLEVAWSTEWFYFVLDLSCLILSKLDFSCPISMTF